jgi:hypothetical protein
LSGGGPDEQPAINETTVANVAIALEVRKKIPGQAPTSGAQGREVPAA